MATPLPTYTAGRDNNFNLLRFAAASLVLFSHSYALAYGSGKSEPIAATFGITGGYIAVDVFFFASGFLVTGSYFSRNNLSAFVRARVLRIYPALIVSTFFCALVIGAGLTSLDTAEYLAHPQNTSSC